MLQESEIKYVFNEPVLQVGDILLMNTYHEGQRAKMKGCVYPGQDSATLSQGTFTAQLITLISKNPAEDAIRIKRKERLVGDDTLPLRDYFIEEQDEVILKLMLNCFNAVRNVFPDEYNKPKDNILWKTTGFSAIIKSFPELYHAGERKHDLTEAFFTEAFKKVKSLLGEKGVSLSGAAFAGGGKQLQQQLAQLVVEAMTTY